LITKLGQMSATKKREGTHPLQLNLQIDVCDKGIEEDRRARAALDQDQEGMKIKDIFVGFGERLRILS
jgi:hypothetical protein